MLYNSGDSVDEIQFEEIKWTIGDQAKVTKHRVGPHPIHVKIAGLPVQKLCHKQS